MKIVKKATAGTLESGDVYVELSPSDSGNEIELQSAVLLQFGDAIRESAQDVLRQFEVENAKLKLIDQGALDCVIRARIETAVLRGKEA
ncbi:MAG: citrate lyase acyl carrier protein [Oscillospiraceae bacterium]|nr:citrate lyase acyl carrier protein [Oscillospiraceae bacterium]